MFLILASQGVSKRMHDVTNKNISFKHLSREDKEEIIDAIFKALKQQLVKNELANPWEFSGSYSTKDGCGKISGSWSSNGINWKRYIPKMYQRNEEANPWSVGAGYTSSDGRLSVSGSYGSSGWGISGSYKFAEAEENEEENPWEVSGSYSTKDGRGKISGSWSSNGINWKRYIPKKYQRNEEENPWSISGSYSTKDGRGSISGSWSSNRAISMTGTTHRSGTVGLTGNEEENPWSVSGSYSTKDGRGKISGSWSSK